MRFNTWKLWLSTSAALLTFSSCGGVQVKDTKICTYVGIDTGLTALCAHTIFDDREIMSLDQWVDFLGAQVERPDPNDPTKTLPEKGPAVCTSSEDYAKQKNAVDQACAKINCTYEQKKAISEITNRIDALIENAYSTKAAK